MRKVLIQKHKRIGYDEPSPIERSWHQVFFSQAFQRCLLLARLIDTSNSNLHEKSRIIPAQLLLESPSKNSQISRQATTLLPASNGFAGSRQGHFLTHILSCFFIACRERVSEWSIERLQSLQSPWRAHWMASFINSQLSIAHLTSLHNAEWAAQAEKWCWPNDCFSSCI